MINSAKTSLKNKAACLMQTPDTMKSMFFGGNRREIGDLKRQTDMEDARSKNIRHHEIEMTIEICQTLWMHLYE